MNSEPDLSGFPVLRIDQISLIDSDTLANAHREAKSLIQDLLAESSGGGGIPPMVIYLRKQNEAVSAELMNRLAQDRINALLSGATSLLNNDRNKYVLDQEEDDAVSTLSMSTLTHKTEGAGNSSSDKPKSTFEPLPLPSERRVRQAAQSTAAPTADTSTHSQSSYVPAVSSLSGTDLVAGTQVSPMRRSESSPVGIAMSSRSTTDRDISGGRANRAMDDSGQHAKRPLSGDGDMRISRRNQLYLNENFGNKFIVAGEGRRRRPLPAKKVIEPVEEVKAREKAERRKAAMQRLLERKEQRMKEQMAKKEAQRADKREQERAKMDNTSSTRSQRAPAAAAGTAGSVQADAGDSSGSESVSGGDYEPEVPILPEMVAAVAEAQLAEKASASAQTEDIVSAKQSDTSSAGPAETPQQTLSTSEKARPTFSSVKSPLAKGSQPQSPQRSKRSPNHSAPRNSEEANGGEVVAGTLQSQTPTKVRAAHIISGDRQPRRRGEAVHPNEASDTEGENTVERRRRAPRNAQPTGIPKLSAKPLAGATSHPAGGGGVGAYIRQAPDLPGGVEDASVSMEELEVKNTAALMALRSMKLKKEQQRADSFKAGLSFTEQLALAPLDSSADEEGGDGGDAGGADSRACTALTLQGTGEVGLCHSNSEQALTIHGADAGTLVVSSGDTSLVVSENSMVEYEPRTAAVFVGMDAGEVELTGLNLHRSAEPSTIHVREASLQVDPDPPADEAPQRPTTVPLPPSPSRWTPSVTPREEPFRPHDAPLGSPSRRRSIGAMPAAHHQDAAHSGVAESIDLSGETLEVDMSRDGFILPAESRTIVGPNHPAVTHLLAGHVHSALVYVDARQYCAKLGPDDLPGLCAWKLVSIVDECANWVVNIAKYTRVVPGMPRDASHAAVYARRAVARRSVSLGLLVLMLDTEDLMLGRLRLYGAEHFTTLWKEHIRLFDEKAEALAVQFGPAVLFTEVAVCGNCHAVCKKLENLLKTLFVPRNNSAEATLHRALHAQDEFLPPPSPETGHCDHHDDSDLDGTGVGAGDNDSQPDGSLIDDDDDGSIVPVYPQSLYSQFVAQQKQEQEAQEQNAADEQGDSVPAATGASDADASPLESEGSKRKNARMAMKKQAATRKAAAGADRTVNLTEYYPSISSIFPAVHGMMSNRSAGEGSADAARMLIEAMQVQCKIYEEWIEVMSDYSTVFSEDRGVAEHYFGKNGDDEVGGAGAGSAAVYKGGTRSLHFRVKSGRSEVNNIVTDVFNNFLKEWEELPQGLGLGLSWNILWTWSKPRIKMTHLLAWQRVNHYPDSKELTRKDLLKRNIQRYTVMGGKGGAHFDIMPQTFLLPNEYTAFVQAFTAAEASKIAEGAQNYWILKPVGLSRGRGISMVKDLSEITYSQASVVQKYIERPLCLQGYKFDLRLYVVVTSFKPLEAFIYRDGFARVSTHQYSLDPEDTANMFIHLTNSSIQCKNTEAIAKDNPLQVTGNEDQDNDTGGSKISLLGANGLWKRLQAFGIDIAALWQSICVLVLKSLVVVDDKIANQPCCFELFGYDVLVDADLRPWLLEVNASPSLARTNALDVRVKNAMIRDIINIIDPAPFDRAAVLRILQRRLTGIAKNRCAVGRNDPELEQDLRDILGDYVPRRYGEPPAAPGNYQMICPGTKEFEQVLKLKKKIIKS